MLLALRDNLLFATASVSYRDVEIEVLNMLVDTGSASTIFATDVLAQIGIMPEPEDTLVKVYGVGGAESVFARRVERLQIGSQIMDGFEINVGAMDYGLDINGILGMDFLLTSGAVLNLHTLEMNFQQPNA